MKLKFTLRATKEGEIVLDSERGNDVKTTVIQNKEEVKTQKIKEEFSTVIEKINNTIAH